MLNSSTLLNGVYVLTGLGLSDLFSVLVLFRRQEKAYRVKVRVSHSWARNATAMNLCPCVDMDRLNLNLSVHAVCSVFLFYNATKNI